MVLPLLMVSVDSTSLDVLSDILRRERNSIIRLLRYKDFLSDQRAEQSCMQVLLTGLDAISARERAAVRRWTSNARDVLILNDPRRTLYRFDQLQALYAHGINRVEACKPFDGVMPSRYPVFLREGGPKGRLLSSLISSERSLRQWMNKLTESLSSTSDVICVEFANGRVIDDLYRKYSAFVVGGVVIPESAYVSNHWWVRSRNVILEKSIAETFKFKKNFDDRDILIRAAQICGVDYGKIDFTFTSDGIHIFEINLDPVIRETILSLSNKDVNHAIINALSSGRE